jgi:tetratricopeptide (TPR) repeat protein
VALSPEDPVLANLHKSLQPACEANSNSVCEGTGISKDSEDQSLFATATVADLYVRQGHLDKARNIYQELLQAHPDDETFRERIAYVDKLLAEQPSLTDSDSASSMRLGVAPPQSPDSQRDVVAILQKWLEAIQSRREYVQKHSAGHC